MTNILANYFRCPEKFAACFDSDEASGRAGYFRFGSSTLYGRPSRGSTATDPAFPLEDMAAHVAITGSRVSLPFDASEAVENLLLERYAAGYPNQSASGLRSLVWKAYYQVRPVLPVAVRKHLQRISLRGRVQSPFPSWPVDRSVDNFLKDLLALGMEAQGLKQIPFIWFWPDGRSGCVTMTHDVETSEGLSFCSQLMDLNDSYGIKSSFQIIPAGRYAASGDLLDEIRQRGFEVNVHDWNHDGLLYSDRRVFLERVELINRAAASYGTEGFRSGVLYRNTDWYDAFTVAYDMSIPNVGHFDPQQGGCCTVMPYFIGQILEIPVTTIQDYSLFHICGDYSIEVWKRQLELIMGSSGLASFIVHPDYVIEKRARETYAHLLQYLAGMRSQRNVWTVCPRDVNRWWRQRSEMKLVQRAGEWEIEGVGSERACVAYATSTEQGVDYSLQQPSRTGLAMVKD